MRHPPTAPFARAPHTRARGTAGEEAAVAWLVERGYRVRVRNYRVKSGEIDLVAVEGDTLCFVEIKARSGRGFGTGAAAVTRRKRRRIARVAALYLAADGWAGRCRFDVLALEPAAAGGWRFDLIRDAFRHEP